MKRTGPSNEITRNLISELKKRANEQKAPIWKRVALDLERATRSRREVNLSILSRYTEDNDVVVVPGKVLGAGSIEHKITLAAFNLSKSAEEKLLKAGCKIISLLDISKESPKGKKIKIIG